MPTFAYQARDEAGRLVKGFQEAESQTLLLQQLRKAGYLITRLEEKTQQSTSWLPDLQFGKRVDGQDLLMAILQLANLVEAGLPLLTALNTVCEQWADGPLKEALSAVVRDIESGEKFSQALKKHPHIFPKLMVSMVMVGEQTGKLDLVLMRFSSFLERDMAERRALQSALSYPILLFCASIVLVLFVVTFVVPQFSELFVKAGVRMPAPTLFLCGVGKSIRQYWWLMILSVPAAGVGVPLLMRRPDVRAFCDRWILKVPIFGKVIYQTVILRFARSLATLVASGISILSALDTAREMVDNQMIEAELKRVRSAVERGEKLSAALAAGKIFHPDVVQMVKAGEESGRMDAMLDKVADFYEMRVNFSLKQMVTFLEPLLLMGMGGIVVLIMASLILPMFDMVKVLQNGGLR